MATNKTSLSGVAVYAQQYTYGSNTSSTIPTGMVSDAYGPAPRNGSSIGHAVQLLPEKNWVFPADGDWIITYTSTDTTHRFVIANQAFTALFA